MKKRMLALLMALLITLPLVSCTKEKEQVIIYTSMNDDVVAHMNEAFQKKFPEYEVVIEYLATSKLTAKVLAEGTKTEGDIVHNVAYENMQMLANAELLADLSSYDTSGYLEDVVASPYYLPEVRSGCAIIINTKVLKDRGLEKPQSYEDLLKPEYKDLITMPDPKASGTGYLFVKSLVNAWGEEKAIAYFDDLGDSILQYTSGSSAVANALSQEEVAVGLTTIANAVSAINAGAPLEIIIPAEGAPCGIYGQAMIKGKETRKCVKDVFDFIINEYNAEHCKEFFPEQIYKDVVFEVENFPSNVVYSDMSNNSQEEKERLLALWPN